MKKVNLLAAAIVAASLIAPAANAANVNFGGYLRSGVMHGNGGQMTKFNVNKVGRLGNENDTYGEVALSSDIATVDDTVWTVNSRLTIASNSRNRDWQQTGGKDMENNEIALREFNVMAKGLLDWDKDAVVWVGKRFYKREDIHITDMYFYDISGYGAGLENLGLGTGKLDIAWIRQDDQADYRDHAPDSETSKHFVSLNKFDVRYNFPVWDGASLQVADTYYVPERDNKSLVLKNEINNANTFDVELNQGYSLGWNKTVLQWMHGSNANGVHYGTGNWLDYNGNSNSANGFRVINFGDTAFTDVFKMQHVINCAWSGGYDDNVDKKSTYSVVVRPFFQLTKMTRIITELGAYWDTTKYKVGDKNKEKGQKFTVAYGLTPDASNVWSRPEIRFFVSYVHGTNKTGDVKNNPSLTLQTGNDANHDVMFGAQVEAWW